MQHFIISHYNSIHLFLPKIILIYKNIYKLMCNVRFKDKNEKIYNFRDKFIAKCTTPKFFISLEIPVVLPGSAFLTIQVL